MKYTLYIDESGDFETPRGQWVLAGLLISDSYANSEKMLSNKLSKMPKQLGVKSIKDFHLTELRRDFGHESAVNMAKQVYSKLSSLPVDYHAIASINFTKSSLSTREKTYRLMLADILAICETTIPEDQVITKLDLVVASRTINGELQTTISNIDQDIIQSLPFALEVDLATKGLVDLMGKNIKVHMKYANESWGLVCADFLANLNYHNRKNNEKNFLEALRQEGKYSLFESFGSFDIRRAHIAERNNDYVLALYRWIVIGQKHSEVEKARKSIRRLLSKVFTNQGTFGHVASFEALIERLWRNNNSVGRYNQLSQKLYFFENEFTEYLKGVPQSIHDNLLFRLRNLRLIVENHLGKTVEAFQIIELQRRVVVKLATNPEYFQMILDFKVSEIETSLNALDLETARSLAIEYSKLMESYKEVWSLLLNDEDLSGFNTSRAFIKSEMSLLKINILCLGLYDDPLLSDIDERFERVGAMLTNKMDKGRLNNYKVMLLLKRHMPGSAVEWFAKEPDSRFSLFDALWFLRAVNDALLASKEIDMAEVNRRLESQLPFLDLNSSGHPVDLVLRELALLEFQTGNKSKAMKYIAKSAKAFDLGKSEISAFLMSVINIHNDYINDKLKADSHYFGELQQCSFVQLILKSAIELPLIRRIRYFSMY